MQSLKGRIRKAYHPAHGGPEPVETPPLKKPLIANKPVARPDPAPSRWSYRLQRLMLTPLFRLSLRVGLPMLATFGIATAWFADEGRRDAFNLAIADMRASIEERPEFMVKVMAVDGAGEEVAEDIREILPVEFPISSFHLDLDHMRDTIAGLDAVENVSLRIKPGGTLHVQVKERVPAVIWRSALGLELLDGGGFRVAPLLHRADRPDLPVIAGEKANEAVEESLSLMAAAAPLASRFRGLERIGERRWDVVLDRGQRIQLPTENPVQALERVIAMDQAMNLLERDLAAVDLRLPQRPTLRMNNNAVEELRRIKATELGVEAQ